MTPGLIHVTHGPTENGFRPAIDPLFRTAANAYGDRVIGVLLSGALDDGVYGLREIKTQGGLVVVQDPDEAEIASLPLNALAHVDVDHVLTAVAIAPLLTRETELQQQQQQQQEMAMGANDLDEPQLPGNKTDIKDMTATLGPPSGLTCPDCGGALWEIKEGHQEFDLLISDIRLPDGSGLDLMRQLRSKMSIRGIAISGFGTEQDRRRSKEAGYDMHLTKPVDFNRLLEAIERVARPAPGRPD